MALWQVQLSRDGHNWVPMKPRSDRPQTSMDPGEHWFPEREPAFIAAQHLRNAVTWPEIRVVRREPDGQIVDEGAVL